MESGSIHAQVTAMLLCLVCAACRPESGPAGQSPHDISQLQSGDLIYRLGNGLYSVGFQEFSQTEKRFSHVGIVEKSATGDSLWVIHAEADDYTGQGGVRRETVAGFLKQSGDCAAYRLPADVAVRDRITALAREFWHRKTPFDISFDADDPTAVYCTELVQYCVNGAVGYPLISAGTEMNGRRYIAVDDTYIPCGMVPVAIK
jgi:hypothetical protein